VTGSDGIGDTPYVINENNVDHYPLINPWGHLPVYNINAGLGYATIQEAIDANETLDGHTIFVEQGTYYETVVVNKTLTLIGENSATTIIDGGGVRGSVLSIIANETTVMNFALQNSWPWGSGIGISGSQKCSLTHNVIRHVGCGITLSHSNHNNISQNIIYENYGSGGCGGIELIVSSYNTVASNRVMRSSGNAISTWMTWDDWHAGVYSRNNLIAHNIILDNAGGISIFYSGYNTVLNNTIGDSGHGISLNHCSHYDHIIGNIIFRTTFGIYVGYPWAENVTNNRVQQCKYGVYVYSPYYRLYTCYFSANDITDNEYGIHISCGILPPEAMIFYHNNIVNNTFQVDVFQGYNGIWDDGYPSGGNYWSDYIGVDEKSGPNQDQSGSDGIGDTPYIIDANNQDHYPLMRPWPTRIVETMVRVGGEEYTIIVEANVTITHVFANPAALFFNASGPTGAIGYINATIPVTLKRTPPQVPIKVFINNTEVEPPWPIITTNTTHYFVYFQFNLSTHRIMVQYAIADIAVTNITPSKTVAGQGYSVYINVTIKNHGSYTECFDVSVFYDDTIITLPDGKNHTTTTLPSGNSTTLTLTWNTTGVAKGNYTITAEATQLPHETDTTDNTLSDGWIIVAMVGDITGGTLNLMDFIPDGKVDMKDIGVIAKYFGQTVPPAPSNCDLTGPTTGLPDDKIDMRDIGTVARNFGKTDP